MVTSKTLARNTVISIHSPFPRKLVAVRKLGAAMASPNKGKAEKLEGLMCPVCMEVLKNPTLLSCGHTFCKACLKAFDTQHYGLDHISCPVCRKNTYLGPNRIDALTPNFLALGIQDVPPGFCPLHSEVHNDIFCEDCKEFICLTCYLENHKDHKIKKKEKLERDLERERDSLIQRCQARKSDIEKCMNYSEQHKIDIHCHLSNLETQIQVAFARQVEILKERRVNLLGLVNNIHQDMDMRLGSCTATKRQLIDDIDSSVTGLKCNAVTSGHLDSDSLKLYNAQCINLENLLRKDIGVESSESLKLATGSIKFCPMDKKSVILGFIEQNGKQIAVVSQQGHTKQDNKPLETANEAVSQRSGVSSVPPGALIPNRATITSNSRQLPPAAAVGGAVPSRSDLSNGVPFPSPNPSAIINNSPHVAPAASVAGAVPPRSDLSSGGPFPSAWNPNPSAIISNSPHVAPATSVAGAVPARSDLSSGVPFPSAWNPKPSAIISNSPHVAPATSVAGAVPPRSDLSSGVHFPSAWNPNPSAIISNPPHVAPATSVAGAVPTRSDYPNLMPGANVLNPITSTPTSNSQQFLLWTPEPNPERRYSFLRQLFK